MVLIHPRDCRSPRQAAGGDSLHYGIGSGVDAASSRKQISYRVLTRPTTCADARNRPEGVTASKIRTSPNRSYARKTALRAPLLVLSETRR